MKKTRLFLLAAAALFAFVSCEKEIANPTKPVDENTVVLTINADKSGDIDTKTSLSGTTPSWAAGDKVSVVYTNTSDEVVKAESSALAAAAASSSFTVSLTSPKTAVEAHAYYPSNNLAATASTAKLVIASEQHPTGTSFDGGSDILVSSGFTPSGTVSTSFRRLGAVLQVKLSNAIINSEKLVSFSLSASSPLAGNVNVGLADGVATSIESGSNTVTAAYESANQFTVSADGKYIYLIVYPQTLAAGTSLTFSGETEDHAFSHTVASLSSAIVLKPGHITPLNISLANGDIVARDTPLWSENFSSYSADAVPGTGDGSGYGGATINYSVTNGGGTTKVYAENTAGDSSPELLVAKTNGTFKASGIPTGGWKSFTLSYYSNATTSALTVSVSVAGATVGSATSLGTKHYCRAIRIPSYVSTFDITFKMTTGSNARLDGIELTAGAPLPGITVTTADATSTSSEDGTTATLNGSLALINEAVNAKVSEAGFYYKLSSAGAYTKVTCASAPTSTTSFSYELTGLTKDSEYTYYAYAIYDGGSEVTGESTKKTFTPVKSSGSTTVSVSISTYASGHSWSNGTQYTSITMDSNVTVTVSGGGNSGKYYTSGSEWRLYQTESASLTISAGTKTLSSVTVTYNVSNTGTLKNGSTTVSSGTAIDDINASSITLNVGNTGSATNGQVKITAISVTYL